MLVTDIICAEAGSNVQSQTAKATENTKATRTAIGLDWPSTRLGEGIGDVSRIRSALVQMLDWPPDPQNGWQSITRNYLKVRRKTVENRLQTRNLRLAAELRQSCATRWIITTGRAGWERFARHFLGQLCLFRQPRPGRAGRRPSLLPVWPEPVSACQHGL